MDLLLVGVNAKYIHTALGIRSIKAYVEKYWDGNLSSKEYTINQSLDEIVKSLYFTEADVYLFSCYIWNTSVIKSIASQLSKIRPHSKIFLGGPEATYKAERLIKERPFLDGIILGEGEQTVLELAQALSVKAPLDDISGLLLNSGNFLKSDFLDMDKLEFSYPDINLLGDQILYYESMRGCPFSCSYCLSSVEHGVRMRSTQLVLKDLQRFITAKPRQVKFVDRTFNCNSERARTIWQFLIDNDNQITNYHFELAGDLLDEQSIALLSKTREGLFQFEIGVQSTNPKTLDAIQRTTDLERLKQNIQSLKKLRNIHLHLDLIAGLPYENFDSFVRSFHWVYGLCPDQFQLGFLKVLGGSQMEAKAEEYKLLYQNDAPFQVLSTQWLSYEELAALGGVENMVDAYYNSGRFSNTINYLVSHFESPFGFYLKLSEYYPNYKANGPLSKTEYYDLLGAFALDNGIEITNELQELCRYDICLHEKPKKYPHWAEKITNNDHKALIWSFYQNPENTTNYLPQYEGKDPKYISRVTHLEIFQDIFPKESNQATGILFDYDNRSFLKQSRVQVIQLETSN